MNEKSLKLLNIINKISNPENSECPNDCPNIKNKPQEEGCGLDMCLDQIFVISKYLKNSIFSDDFIKKNILD